MSEYIYTKEPVNPSQLTTEIQGSSITVALDYINTTASQVNVFFKAALSGAEQTTLSGLLDSHVADFTPVVETVVLGHTLTDGSIESDVHTKDGKLRVLASHKPTQAGVTYYNYFSSSGDNWENNQVASGTLFKIQTASGEVQTAIDLKFMNYNDSGSNISIYGGAFAWEDAGWGDCMNVEVRGKASSVVPRVVATGLGLDVDYDLDGDRIKYAGPDAGDYALGGFPVWIPNFSGTGCWDLDTINVAAVPNALGTGEFDWHTTEQFIGHYVSDMLVYGTNHAFTHLDATESVPLPYGHWLRIVAHNTSDTVWKFWGFVKLYRENLK